jgi:hypothetical protein
MNSPNEHGDGSAAAKASTTVPPLPTPPPSGDLVPHPPTFHAPVPSLDVSTGTAAGVEPFANLSRAVMVLADTVRFLADKLAAATTPAAPVPPPKK